MKIVTLTLNPALDKSSAVDKLIPEQKMRCSPLRYDAGGGGINVSKGIHRLGGKSVAVFPSGGANGGIMCDILKKGGIDILPVETPGQTRENFSITESASNLQYRFTLAGEMMTEKIADHCLLEIGKIHPQILVASGSLPPGIDTAYYEKVAAFAKSIGAKFILDTSGEALKAAADEGLYLLKPNIGELANLVGTHKLEMNQVDDAAMEIIRQGKCTVVVVSLGPSGALLVTRDAVEHVPAPQVVKKSTVGAGDSMVAGMVWSLAHHKSFSEMVRTGVACGTAATMNPGTELFHLDDFKKLLQWINTYGERYRIKNFE